MRTLIATVICLLFPAFSWGGAGLRLTGRMLPDYLQLQYAGNLGFLSAGIGFSAFRERLHISLLEGFTPSGIGGRNINQVSLKAGYDLYRFQLAGTTVTPYAALAVSFETSGNGFYGTLPSRYPEGYYRYSAVHALGLVGIKGRLQPGGEVFSSVELYLETGTVDSYLYFYFQNTHLKFTELFSGAAGLIYHLK